MTLVISRLRLTAVKLLSLLALTSLIGGCSDPCGDEPVTSAQAPDHRGSAILFQRACGAATGFSTQISLERRGRKLRGAGNIFRADGDHGKARAGAWGGPWAETRWLSERHLLVRYAATSRIFKQATRIYDIKISYEAVP